jgi:hypothetical protein
MNSKAMMTLWTFLNSSLGLWLLTAVLITGAGSIYTRIQADVAAQRADSERAAKEDIEISYRYSQLLNSLAEIRSDVADRRESIAEALWFATTATKQGQGVYNEFDKFSIISLEVDLRRVLRNNNHTTNDLAALNQSISRVASLSAKNRSETDPAKAAASVL